MVKKIVYNLLKIMWFFKVKHKKIFLTSFDGTAYGFDSKAVVDFINENYPNEYLLIWGTKENELAGYDGSSGMRLVKIKSIQGVYHMMTAGVLIYNINPPSYIPFRKSQTLINTWHGFAYKKVGKYALNFNSRHFNTSTCFLSHSKSYTTKVIRDSFEFTGEVLDIGVPRNDILFRNDKKQIQSIRKILSIGNKNIVLFAPTFRGDFSYEKAGVNFSVLKESLRNRYGGEWVVLCRLHPMIAHKYKMDSNGAIDVSAYPDMQELLLISDVLVTDYSSSMWDFALTRKKVFLYADDIDKYIADRGFYQSPETWPFPIAKTNDELARLITNYQEEVYQERLKKYFDMTGNYENGTSCQKLLEYIRAREE